MPPEAAAVGTSQTDPQLVSRGWVGQQELYNPLPASYATYRTMRKHPTIALGRALTIAPVVAAQWSYEADDDADDEWVQFIQAELNRIREPLLQTALEGGCDFGWAPFEKVFHLTRDGRIGVRRLKSLLQDHTTILIDQHGEWVGFKQWAQVANDGTGNEVHLFQDTALLFSFRVEGTQWHGQSLLENVREPYNNWAEANAGAARYDKKLAGSHWVIFYPPGTSKLDGVETENGKVAKEILQQLESSGSVSVPRSVAKSVEELNREREFPAWEISLMSDQSPRQPSFVDRLNYLDKLLIRGLLTPERAILEGQFGTKAEAGVHADIAVIQRELEHRHVTRVVNEQVVDQLLTVNFGPDTAGKVRAVAAPLVDADREWLREVYKAVLDNPQGFLEEIGWIDRDGLKDKIGVPKNAEIAGDDPIEQREEGMETEGRLAASMARVFARAMGGEGT